MEVASWYFEFEHYLNSTITALGIGRSGGGIPQLGKEYSQPAQNWSGQVLVVTLKASRIVLRNHDIVGDIAIFILYSA